MEDIQDHLVTFFVCLSQHLSFLLDKNFVFVVVIYIFNLSLLSSRKEYLKQSLAGTFIVNQLELSQAKCRITWSAAKENEPVQVM